MQGYRPLHPRSRKSRFNNRLEQYRNTYKNWDLNTFFNGAFGAKRLNIVRYCNERPGGASTFVTG